MSNQDEKDIIKLIKEGKTNREIAAIVFKSVGSVKQIVSKLMKKHNCKNRVQLAIKDID